MAGESGGARRLRNGRMDLLRVALARSWTARAALCLAALLPALSARSTHAEPAAEWPAELLAVLEDDLNTPLVRGVLRNLARDLNKATNPVDKTRLKADLLTAGQAVGLLQMDPEAWFTADETGTSDGADDIDGLVTARGEARARKDFAEADRLRDELSEMGIVLEDKPDGTTVWRRA